MEISFQTAKLDFAADSKPDIVTYVATFAADVKRRLHDSERKVSSKVSIRPKAGGLSGISHERNVSGRVAEIAEKYFYCQSKPHSPRPAIQFGFNYDERFNFD